MSMLNLLSLNQSLKIICLGLLSGLVLGCSSDGEERPEYMDATSVKHLEVPPKLTQPDTRAAMRLPKPSDKAHKQFQQSSKPSQTAELAPRFKGVALKNDSRLFWLEIDSPMQNVWISLLDFLAAEGIEVQRVDRTLGFIDTQWLNEYAISYGKDDSGSSWFASFSPDYKDKFRLRVEAGPKQQTRLFVTHRGMQVIVGDDDASAWQQRDSETLLEREIMYRYMLYTGASKTGATQLLANYRSFHPRVNASDDQPSQFEVQGNRKTVWLRLKAAIDRSGAEMLQFDHNTGLIKVKVGNLKEIPGEDEGGWFSGLFGKDIVVDEEDELDQAEQAAYRKPEVKAEDQITLAVEQIAKPYASTIKLKVLSGGDINHALAQDFRKALIRLLK